MQNPNSTFTEATPNMNFYWMLDSAPDANPIENVWAFMKRKLQEQRMFEAIMLSNPANMEIAFSQLR